MINNVELVVVSSQCRQTTVVNNFGEFLNFILIPVVYGDRVKLEKKRKKKKKKRSNVEEILVSVIRIRNYYIDSICFTFSRLAANLPNHLQEL